MNRAPSAARLLCIVASLTAARSSLLGFLGVGDTSFVTVIANPADAAHWTAELSHLADQVAALRKTLDDADALRAYAGDPRLALQDLGDLGTSLGTLAALGSGPRTAADLEAAWRAGGTGQQTQAALALLGRAGAGIGGTMNVFGSSEPRDVSAYDGLASQAYAANAARGQIAQEQGARSALIAALDQSWSDFQDAPTESRKQAILTKISHLEAQGQALDSRRRALLDDLDLADRERATVSETRTRAADEAALAESAALAGTVAARVQAAEAQRLATLAKGQQAAAPADYSGLKLWTTADASASSP